MAVDVSTCYVPNEVPLVVKDAISRDMKKPEHLCQWSALCNNIATTTIQHPILGAVPCCARCAERAN